MEDDLPLALITPEERWQDMGSALHALVRVCFREGERERTKEYERERKARQRDTKRTNGSGIPTHDQDAARLTS